MFGKSQSLEFQCLEKTKFRIPILKKRKKLEFHCLKKPKFKNPMIEKGKIYMSNV